MGENIDALNNRITEISDALAQRDKIINYKEAQNLELAQKFNDWQQELSFERGKRQTAEDLLLKFKDGSPAVKPKNAQTIRKKERKTDKNCWTIS